MTTAFDAQGTILGISASTTAEVYVPIGEVKEFVIDRSAPEIDVSNFDSTFREYLPGLPDGGKFTATCNLQSNTSSSATGQGLVLDAFNNLSNRYFRLTLDNTTGTDAAYKWTGPVLSYNLTGGVDKAWELTFAGRMNTTTGTFAATTG